MSKKHELEETRGRKTLYSKEMIERVCEYTAQGESLTTMCKRDDMPTKVTIINWLNAYPEFALAFEEAKRAKAESLADEIIDIADDHAAVTFYDADGNRRIDAGAVAHAKLRIDSRKWSAAKLKPKTYGDKMQTEVSGSLETMSEEEIDKKIAILLAKINAG